MRLSNFTSNRVPCAPVLEGSRPFAWRGCAHVRSWQVLEAGDEAPLQPDHVYVLLFCATQSFSLPYLFHFGSNHDLVPMAGFGFSPTDIVEFGKFAYKIKVALRDDGGSAAEYQDAIERCESFEAALKEVQNLELSNVSTTFADQLRDHAEHTKELMLALKKKIVKYEKALGADAKKGAASGTARKVQWAVTAAKDLDKFGQSLQLRIQVLEMLMASRTLYVLSAPPLNPCLCPSCTYCDRAHVDQIPSLRAEAGKVGNAIMDIRRIVGRVSNQQEVINFYLAEIFSEIRYLRSMESLDVGAKVLELTATITQLLAGRPDVKLIEGVPRAWTIPDGMDYAVEKDQETLESFINLRPRKVLIPAAPSSSVDRRAVGERRPSAQPQSANENDELALGMMRNRDWIDDTNEVLHALELPLIRVDDGLADRLCGEDQQSDEATVQIDSPHGQPQINNSSSEWQTRSSAQRNKVRKRGRFLRGMEAAMRESGAMGMGAGVMGVAALMTQMISILSDIEETPRACARVADRLEDLAPLLEEIANMMATDDTFRGGRLIVDRAKALYDDVAHTLSMAMSSKWGSFKWVIERKTVEALLAEMESLKLTLSCTLQTHAVKLHASNHEQMMRGMLRLRQVEQDIRTLQDVMRPPNAKGKGPA